MIGYSGSLKQMSETSTAPRLIIFTHIPPLRQQVTLAVCCKCVTHISSSTTEEVQTRHLLTRQVTVAVCGKYLTHILAAE